MGAVSSCCEAEQEYDQGIKAMGDISTITPVKPSTAPTDLSTIASNKEMVQSPFSDSGNSYLNGNSNVLGFDLKSPVFEGSTVDQKFSNKSTYDSKFVWINFDARTINLSEYTNKGKRHKEASLSDVVNVVAGPPDKHKAVESNATGGTKKLDISTCLTITFVRGGGIDLRFKDEAERDAWYVALTKLLALEKTKKNE